MDLRTSSHLKYEDFQGYRTYPISMSGMNNVTFNHMQAKPQANFPVPNHHITSYTSPSKMNKSSQDQVIGVVSASFCSIRVEGQTVPFVDFKKNPEVYELHQLIPSGTPFAESEDHQSMISLLPQERVSFPQSSSNSKPVYRMKPHILNPEAEEYIPKTMRQAKQNGEMISSPSCSSDGTNAHVDDVTNELLASQSHYSSRFSPVTENISQNSSEASKEVPLIPTREIQSHNLQDINTNSSLKMDEELSKNYKLEENKPIVCKGKNETDNSSSQKLSCSLSESVPPKKLNISHNSSLAFESQHDSVCNSISSGKGIFANTYNAVHINSLINDIENESNSPKDSNSYESLDNDEKKQSDCGSDIDSDSDSEDTDSQCSEESDSDDSICESDDDEVEAKEDTKFCLDDSFICFENVDADDSLCESDNEEASQNEDEDKWKCLSNGNVKDGFEDDICFEDLVDNNELIDAQSNVTQEDNELTTSDIDSPSEEEDCDYDCDLFKVELSNNEWDLQLGGLEISNLVSQCICPRETSGSPNNNDLPIDYIFDEVDCSPNLALVNEEVVEANRRWNMGIDYDYRRGTPQVKFCDDVEIHLADDWCRKGPWEECARDRMRFRRRIEETEAVLSPVLTSQHRCKVLRARISACK